MTAATRRRVIIDTDAKNEADDQYAIVHALLSPTLDVRGLVPAHFGTARLRELHQDMHLWSNLWRRTDPIGGPVGIGAADDPVDCGPLLDPVAYGRSAAHPLPEPVLGHSDYQADPAFAEQRALLLLRLPDAKGVPAQPSQGVRGSRAGPRGRADQGSSGRSSG